MLDISPALLLLIFLFKLGQAFFSALTWRNILAAAYPDDPLSISFVLGVDQGQDAVNMLSPVRAGTWAMLGLFGLAIPGAHAGTLAAVWGVQTIGYAIFALINYVALALLLPGTTEGHNDLWQRLSTYGTHRPWISTLILLVVVVAVLLAPASTVVEGMAVGVADASGIGVAVGEAEGAGVVVPPTVVVVLLEALTVATTSPVSALT